MTLFDSTIADASAQLQRLSDIETVREKDMEIGVGIDYPNTAPDANTS